MNDPRSLSRRRRNSISWMGAPRRLLSWLLAKETLEHVLDLCKDARGLAIKVFEFISMGDGLDELVVAGREELVELFELVGLETAEGEGGGGGGEGVGGGEDGGGGGEEEGAGEVGETHGDC